jgi:hypothetical protein
MKNKSTLVLALVITCSACTSAKKQEKPPAPTAAWTSEMQIMAKDVRELIPFVYKREAFHAPANHAIIEANLKDFSENIHKITPKMGEALLGDDPLVTFSLDSLEDDLKRAYYAFQANQLEYSRTVVKSSLNHCFRCHSLTEIGSTAHWEIKNLNQLELSPIDKADLLVATRKYDLATDHMEKLIGSEDFLKNHPFEYEALLRRYMALIIRAENKPSRAAMEMDKVAAKPGLPHYIAEQVQGWRVSLKQWLHELRQPTRKQLPPLKLAQSHIDQATRLQQFPQDHAGDVEYLRATSVLHENLKKHLSPDEEAQSLLLLGRAYEVLDELGSWNLHEVYFTACVHKAPKSKWAKACYSRLEASVLQGYSGSSGTHLPEGEKEKLEKLKGLL